MRKMAVREEGTMLSLLVRIEHWRGALPLEAVEEVVRAVAITPLSGARGSLLGYVNVRGESCPVIDARRVLQLHRRALQPSDRMVILGVGTDRFIIPVDEAGRVSTVRVVEDLPSQAVEPAPSGTPPGLRAARIDEPEGEIVALVDPMIAFGHLAPRRSPSPATAMGSARGA